MNLTMKLTMAITTMTAGLVAAVLITRPADAKGRTCHARVEGCIKRCMAAHDDTAGQAACTDRTCSHQFQARYAG